MRHSLFLYGLFEIEAKPLSKSVFSERAALSFPKFIFPTFVSWFVSLAAPSSFHRCKKSKHKNHHRLRASKTEKNSHGESIVCAAWYFCVFLSVSSFARCFRLRGLYFDSHERARLIIQIIDLAHHDDVYVNINYVFLRIAMLAQRRTYSDTRSATSSMTPLDRSPQNRRALPAMAR